MKRVKGGISLSLALAAVKLASPLALAPLARAEEPPAKPVQPYIDSIKSELELEDAEGAPRPSIEEERQRLRQERTEGDESFIEKVKRESPEAFESPTGQGTTPGFIEEQRARIGDKETGGAIQALHEGRSELRPRFQGEIHNAFGIRVGASVSRQVTGAAVARDFETVYGTGFRPDVGIFYEYQPFRSEWAGNVGVIGSVGASYFAGKGEFQYSVQKAWDTSPTPGSFDPQARTNFRFFIVPISLGLDYRFNLFHYLRPFVIAAPTAIAYFESRDDDVEGFQGYSKAIYLSGGVSILLDWLSDDTSWDQYATNRIRHSYLTIELSSLKTFAGDVDFSVSGLTAGFTFEY